MKVVSYNVNGIRAAINKKLDNWVKKVNPDVFCMQEVKAVADQIDPKVFEELGYKYQNWFSAQKKGYSGVATFSKLKPTKVDAGIGIELFDNEGRVLRTDFDDVTILNCYFPSGSSGEERHQVKMQFLEAFTPWVNNLLKKRKKVIVVGDYNIVHLDLDIHNPNRRDKPSGFRPEERKWINDWFSDQFVDAYRKLNPDKADVFSWWSYRAGARKRNKGWRIDYASISNELQGELVDAGYYHKAIHSDHCPVYLELKA